MQSSGKTDRLSEDRVKGSFGIGIGILLAIGMQTLATHVHPAILWALFIPSTAIFIAGCTFYSKSKGYSPYLGILGFAWIFGLIPLILLPDRKDTTLKDLQAEFMARRNQKRSRQ